MLIEHRGIQPRIHESAYIAPTAVICGDVTIGKDSRVLFGAVIVAEGGPVVIGNQCIIRENAVIRGTDRHSVRLGNHVLVGPRSYLTGCTVDFERHSHPVFLNPAAMPLIVMTMTSRRASASLPSGSGKARRRRSISTWT